MNLLEAIEKRHSVRQYTEQPLAEEAVRQLQEAIAAYNAEGRLHIRLLTEEPQAFSGRMARYGTFRNVKNYLVMAGLKEKGLEERCGYYGERLVLLAQTLGVDSCWVGLTYRKVPSVLQLAAGDRLVCVIALGYAAVQGKPHKSKKYEDVTPERDAPGWFRRGVEAALRAPTALNQQRFRILLRNGRPEFKAGWGFYTNVDLGIVRAHFELGAAGAKE